MTSSGHSKRRHLHNEKGRPYFKFGRRHNDQTFRPFSCLTKKKNFFFLLFLFYYFWLVGGASNFLQAFLIRWLRFKLTANPDGLLAGIDPVTLKL